MKLKDMAAMAVTFMMIPFAYGAGTGQQQQVDDTMGGQEGIEQQDSIYQDNQIQRQQEDDLGTIEEQQEWDRMQREEEGALREEEQRLRQEQEEFDRQDEFRQEQEETETQLDEGLETETDGM